MTEIRIPIVLSVLALAGATSAIASAQPRPAPGHAPTAAPTTAAPSDPATLSDDAKLERVKGLYRANQYLECIDAFAQLLDSKPPGLTDPDVIESARIWDAMCLLGAGDKPHADASLRKALEAKPLMAQPDNLTYPQAVIDEFLHVRETMSKEIEEAEAKRRAAEQKRLDAERARATEEKERLRRLAELAGTERVTIVNQRWIAAVPLGVGQFQNHQDALGWLFLSSETVLAATAVTSVYVRTKLDAELPHLKDQAGAQDAANLLATWQAIGKISGWGLVAVAAIGIGHAELTFVPEFRTTKHRKLPPDLEKLRDNLALRIEPEIAPLPGGVGLGIRGTF